jgi:hypothetical protein
MPVAEQSGTHCRAPLIAAQIGVAPEQAVEHEPQ